MPAAVVEVASVVYRLLFVLLDSLRTITTDNSLVVVVDDAQAARLRQSAAHSSRASSFFMIDFSFAFCI